MKQRDAWDESDLSREPGAPKGYGRGDRRYEPDGAIQSGAKVEGVYRGKDHICRRHYGRPVIHICSDAPLNP